MGGRLTPKVRPSRSAPRHGLSSLDDRDPQGHCATSTRTSSLSNGHGKDAGISRRHVCATICDKGSKRTSQHRHLGPKQNCGENPTWYFVVHIGHFPHHRSRQFAWHFQIGSVPWRHEKTEEYGRAFHGVFPDGPKEHICCEKAQKQKLQSIIKIVGIVNMAHGILDSKCTVVHIQGLLVD